MTTESSASPSPGFPISHRSVTFGFARMGANSNSSACSVGSLSEEVKGAGAEQLGRRMSPGLLEKLGGAVGPAHVVIEPEVMASYGIDWTGVFQVGRAPLSVPVTPPRWRRSSPRAKRPGPRSSPKGATRGSSAEASLSPAKSSLACAGCPASPTSIRSAASYPSVPGRRSPTFRRRQRCRLGLRGRPRPAVTVRRSVGPSPPTWAGSRCSVTALRGHSSWVSKPCSGPARPSRIWAV